MYLIKNKKIRFVIYFITAFLFMGFAAYIGSNYLVRSSVEDAGSSVTESSNYKIHSSTGQTAVTSNAGSSYRNYDGYIQAAYSYMPSPDNDTPAANAGSDTTVYINTLVQLDGSGSSDPDGGQLTYQWLQTSGNLVTLTGVSTARPAFTPTVEGTYIFSLIVTDPGGLSDTDSVTVTVNYKYLLGDFDTDKDIDFEDLALLAVYWKNDNLSGDIGPKKSGETAPFYTEKVAPDNEIDYKDLLVFTFNWDILVDFPGSFTPANSPSLAMAYALSKTIQFNIKKEPGRNLYKIISQGNSDFLGCWIRLEGQLIKSSNLSRQLAENKFIMFTRKGKNYLDLNIVNLSKDNFYISGGLAIAELEIEGDGNLRMSYLIKDNENNAISYAVEQYSTIEQSEQEVAGATLGQNYPNPFNPETWIPFTLSEPGDVKIIIYNLVGQKVRELSLGYRQAGEYKSKERAAFWDGYNNSGDEAASGIYFYKLVAGSYKSVKRMVVLK